VVASERKWTFLSSHGVVLVDVARNNDSTVREIAERAGMTERQAHRVLADLVAEGYLLRSRVGRRNSYRVKRAMPMRHPALSRHVIGELLEVLARDP
jgi:DNA-binding IclR family transcriptional regulator